MPRNLSCLNCKKVGAPDMFRAHGLYCSKGCQQAYESAAEAVADELKTRGFEQHPTVPNLFVKDGVAVSKEQAHRGNLENTLRKHATVAASGQRGS